MIFQIAPKRDHLVLSLHALRTEDEVAEVMRAVEEEQKKGSRNFVVDLSNMQYINSVGINFLIRLKRSCADAKGRMAVCHASSKAVELLEVLRLRSMFFLTDSMEEALLFLRA